MRVAIRALACLLFVAAPLVAGPEESCVRVTRQDGRVVGTGSGTVVASGGGVSRIVTNFHVAGGGGAVTVHHAGKAYPARAVGWDAGLDLCGLEVDAELPACVIAGTPPPVGSRLCQWGHAGGVRQAIHKVGTAVGITGRVVNGGAVWETTIDAREGDSGAGVFDSNNRLVGVCWGRHSDRAGQSCVTLADLRRFLWMDP